MGMNYGCMYYINGITLVNMKMSGRVKKFKESITVNGEVNS